MWPWAALDNMILWAPVGSTAFCILEVVRLRPLLPLSVWHSISGGAVRSLSQWVLLATVRVFSCVPIDLVHLARRTTFRDCLKGLPKAHGPVHLQGPGLGGGGRGDVEPVSQTPPSHTALGGGGGTKSTARRQGSLQRRDVT